MASKHSVDELEGLGRMQFGDALDDLRSWSYLPASVMGDGRCPQSTVAQRMATGAARLLDVSDVVARYGLSATLLRVWRHKGVELRFIQLGNSFLYDRLDIEEWLEARKSTMSTFEPAKKMPTPDQGRGTSFGGLFLVPTQHADTTDGVSLAVEAAQRLECSDTEFTF